jgi:hypothetical protein
LISWGYRDLELDFDFPLMKGSILPPVRPAGREYARFLLFMRRLKHKNRKKTVVFFLLKKRCLHFYAYS